MGLCGHDPFDDTPFSSFTLAFQMASYTSKAQILPEQTIGRGLRLMFRNLQTPYVERVDIIGNPGFIEFVEKLEREEDLQFDTWEVGKDKLVITVIEAMEDRAAYDITLPTLSPIFARSTSISDEIEAIDVHTITVLPLPKKPDSKEAKTFRYEGKDILTLETLVEREYKIPTPQTSGEIVSYLAQIIAHELKMPSQFSVLAPKVRDFLKHRAFGETVDLDDPVILQAISRPLAVLVTRDQFVKLLRDKLNEEQTPVLENAGRLLSGIQPFPWSRDTVDCQKTVFNHVPCDNEFEANFAKFLDRASDVTKFGKLPLNFGFSIAYTDSVGNLRYYYPDFVVVDSDDVHYLVETKGREDLEVRNKDRAATLWAENATALTGREWRYVKVLQKDFNQLEPTEFSDCAYQGGFQMSMFDD
jgi:type III restriction enzyme